jgi:hypothetical protein
MSQAQPICTSTTKAGNACRSFALPERETCLMHTDALRAQVEAARRRGGTVAMKLKVLQGKRQKLDSPRALVKFVSDISRTPWRGRSSRTWPARRCTPCRSSGC